VFAGAKQSGKGTCADYLRAELLSRALEPVQIDFADPLRAVVQTAFGVPLPTMLDPAMKEQPLDVWPFLSPRELLQTVGTDLFRYLWPDVWVRAWERAVLKALSASLRAVVITADCRFHNEGEAARAIDPGAVVVRVERDEVAGADRHASEMEWSSIHASHVMPNNGSLSDLRQGIRTLAADVEGE
jgi:hypothetical protein